MRSIKDKINTSFSRSALTYDKISAVQSLIADKMIKHLKRTTFNKVLEIGSGTGGYTEKLIKINKDTEYILIDFSGLMIKAARKKLSKYKTKIEFKALDAEKINNDLFPKRYFDLITSNSAFQWFSDPGKMFSILYSFLAPHGIFLFSYFGPDTYKELNYALKEYYRFDDLNIPAAGFLTKKQIESLVKRIFHSVKIKEYKIKRDYNSLYDMLSGIRKSGEYGFGLGKRVKLSRTDIKNIERIYLKKFKKIVATSQFFIIFTYKS